MTQLQKAAAMVALALCFAGAVAGELWEASSRKTQPPSGQPPNQSPTATYENKTYPTAKKESSPNRNEAQSLWVPTDSIGLYTLVLSVFTAILAIATISLGVLSFFQIRLARAEYISSHYPRIVLRDVHLIAETVHYTLVNLGSTAAKIVESWIFAEFVEKNTRLKPLTPEGHHDLGQITFAGGESKSLLYPLPAGISFAIKFPDIRRIGIDGRPPILGQRYFVGIMTYTDDLGIKRRSIFRRRWDDESLTFVRLTPEQERDHEYAH